MKNYFYLIKHKESGQALVTLLFFMIFAITTTASAVTVIIVNSLAASKFDQGNYTYNVAESGAENALLKLLRDPNYPGETMTIDSATAIIQVSGTNPKIITSQGKIDSFSRTIQVTADYTNNILTIQSWKEI